MMMGAARLVPYKRKSGESEKKGEKKGKIEQSGERVAKRWR